MFFTVLILGGISIFTGSLNSLYAPLLGTIPTYQVLIALLCVVSVVMYHTLELLLKKRIAVENTEFEKYYDISCTHPVYSRTFLTPHRLETLLHRAQQTSYEYTSGPRLVFTDKKIYCFISYTNKKSSSLLSYSIRKNHSTTLKSIHNLLTELNLESYLQTITHEKTFSIQ